MTTCTGPSFAIKTSTPGVFDCYITGRDDLNRSRIGRAILDLRKIPRIHSIEEEPVLSLGAPGTFDENGTSYPCIVGNYLFYVGWMPTVLTPFQNHIGLAQRTDSGKFKRVSLAPILERTNDDPISSGSMSVRVEGNQWKMWYTSFLPWREISGKPRHSYVIKYAESNNGVSWQRKNQTCISAVHSKELDICRPSIVTCSSKYHMWFCSKGMNYKIGYAVSDNGIAWERQSDQINFTISKSKFDSREMSYPHVFPSGDFLYMLYCGNNYGRQGLGLARLPKKALATS
jgi:hypothetical protein